MLGLGWIARVGGTLVQMCRGSNVASWRFGKRDSHSGTDPLRPLYGRTSTRRSVRTVRTKLRDAVHTYRTPHLVCAVAPDSTVLYRDCGALGGQGSKA